MTEQLHALGHLTARTRSIEGIHHPVYSPHDIYWKFHFLGEQLRYYQNTALNMPDLMNILTKRWNAHHDDLTIYGLAGLLSGIQTDDAAAELDYSRRENSLTYNNLKDFLDKMQTME